jgi:hypothetical protein
MTFDEPMRRDKLPEGRYTIDRADGTWNTYQIEDIKDGTFKGKTIISVLVGSDNTRNYAGCAFFDRRLGIARLWSRWFGKPVADRFASDMQTLLGDPDGAMMDYALKSGRCARCGRVLTVPASLHRGVGPECARIISSK